MKPSNGRRLKILQLVSGTDVNGALTHCRLLARELANLGHHVSIACRQNCWLWNQMEDSQVRMVTCSMKRWPLAELQRFAQWVRREQFDIMHTHMSSAHLFGILLKQMTGIPVVATAHSRHVQPHWRLNDHVIANSTVTARYHRRYNRVRPDRLATIHCFVDTDKFGSIDPVIYRGLRRQWRFTAETRVLMLAGDVVPHKGQWHLFQCLPELVRRFDDLRIVMVGRFKRGEPYTARLRNFQLEHKLWKRVRWIGRRNNMHEMLSAADVVVVPSIIESLGMVALESMAVGTPVVASRTGGLVELIENEHNGLLVPSKDSAAMTEAVTRVLSDKQLANDLVDEGRRVVAEQFSPLALARQVDEVLFQVADGNRRRFAEPPTRRSA